MSHQCPQAVLAFCIIKEIEGEGVGIVIERVRVRRMDQGDEKRQIGEV